MNFLRSILFFFFLTFIYLCEAQGYQEDGADRRERRNGAVVHFPNDSQMTAVAWAGPDRSRDPDLPGGSHVGVGALGLECSGREMTQRRSSQDSD